MNGDGPMLQPRRLKNLYSSTSAGWLFSEHTGAATLNAVIVWCEAYEIGDAEVDVQHRGLIEKINRLELQLHASNPTKRELEFLLQLVEDLQIYVDIHFTHEEACMARHRCPAAAQNRADHARFRRTIDQFKARADATGFNLQLVRELHTLAHDWISAHILGVDQHLRPCLQQCAD